MTLTRRITLACVLASAVMGAGSVLVLNGALERNMVTRSIELVAARVRQEVRNELGGALPDTPLRGADYDEMSVMLDHMTFGDVEQVKIWNRRHELVWAKNKELVGQRYPDNHELEEALAGEVVAEISSAAEQREKYQADHPSLMELYVPIFSEDSNRVECVFEFYQNVNKLHADVRRQGLLICAVIGTGLAVLCVVLSLVAWSASRKLVWQEGEIAFQSGRIRELLETNLDAIIAVDASGKIVLFNKAAGAMFGWPLDEMMGKTVDAIIPEHYRDAHAEGMKRFLSEGNGKIIGKTVQFEGLRKDGTTFPLELSLSASGRGSSAMVTAIIRDVSERIAIQEKLVEAESRATASLLASSIGHELNNAIMGISGYAQLLQEDPSNREIASECAQTVLAEVSKLREQADNLMFLSRPKEVEMRPLLLVGEIERVTDLLRVSGVLKTCKVRLEHRDPDAKMMADESLFEQILRNLEINAAHAMKSGGTLTLRSRVAEDPSFVEFEVSDTGCGIPAEVRDKIFDVYFSTKKSEGGTGLGMFVVKQAVESLKGYVRLESAVGSGTTFTIGLPSA